MSNPNQADKIDGESVPHQGQTKPPIRDGNLTLRRIIGYQAGGMNRRDADWFADKYFVDRLGYR